MAHRAYFLSIKCFVCEALYQNLQRQKLQKAQFGHRIVPRAQPLVWTEQFWTMTLSPTPDGPCHVGVVIEIEGLLRIMKANTYENYKSIS